MKKLFLNILLILVAVFTLVGCNEEGKLPSSQTPTVEVPKTEIPVGTPTVEVPTPTPTVSDVKELTEATAAEAKKCFDFFWERANKTLTSKGYGLIPDRYPNNGLASIASSGFGLTAIPIGVENGWITYEQGYERVLTTLQAMKGLERHGGFFYHFYNYYNGEVASNSEVSNIDTAIFLCGALFAGQYYGGEIQKLAYEYYDEVNWPWYINPVTNQFYMSCKPQKDSQGNVTSYKFEGAWDFYGEQLMMYFLAAGSRTYPIDVTVYDAFEKHYGTYKSYTFINSWFGSIFTYQFSHAWIDFRNIVDKDGIDWYENSVKATYASQKYCIDQSYRYDTFSALSWGLTACDGPKGYSGYYGAPASGRDNTAHKTDGTVALCGAIGSICFAPEIVIPTIDYFYTALEGDLFDEDGYGFLDSYNVGLAAYPYGWVAEDVIGIDKGVSLLMIENYRSEFVWEVFMECEFMDRAIEVLQFNEKQ